jgi:hypothetical protein
MNSLHYCYMILYIKTEFSALVGKLFSAYYGTFFSRRWRLYTVFCRAQSNSINRCPWSFLSLFVYSSLFFFFFLLRLLSSELKSLWRPRRGFRRLDAVLWRLFNVHYSGCLATTFVCVRARVCWVEGNGKG